MTSLPSASSRAALPARFLAGVLAALLLAMAIFYFVMHPPFTDLRAMAMFLSVTTVVSLLIGYAAYRSGWLARLPRFGWTLLGILALSSALTFLNVWLTARLMFASEHDLVLATILLLYASGIAMALGYFLSAALGERVAALGEAARAVASGRLDTRVPEVGRDEIAELGRAFNEMARQLAAAAQKQSELDRLRRDLIAWAGHDLRTPLASVRAIVEALADGVIDDRDERQRYLRSAKRDVAALSDLVDDLFELAQIDAGGLRLERSASSLTDLISDTLESFAALAEQQGVTLRGSAEAGVDPVNMDSSKVGRALANLLSNALRYTPAGGLVEVRLWAEGGEARVEVRDTGSGIPAEDLPHIFDRFFRGEKSRSRASGGSGLGLAIAKGIVEAHGGRITVESAAGAGTRVMLAVPKG